jgi:hypothetical protein
LEVKVLRVLRGHKVVKDFKVRLGHREL